MNVKIRKKQAFFAFYLLNNSNLCDLCVLCGEWSLRKEGKMVHLEDYGTYETAWCPGCGNHSILKAVKQALVSSQLPPSQMSYSYPESGRRPRHRIT